MNHIYRLIWNEVTQTWVAMAEIVKAGSKPSSGTAGHAAQLQSPGLSLLALCIGLMGLPAWALDLSALPTGGKVTAGSAAISQAANVLTVQQTSQRAALDWQTFNIGAAATVNFNQPNANAVALNRIAGNDASQIYGKLNANGQVFFSNPNGMLFANGAQVNVGGLLATTLNVSNADFMAGNYRFTDPGNGSIRNEGLINASGSVVLVGNTVQNAGQIIATTATLAAGNTVALDLTGDGLIRARVEDVALKASIENSGSIEASAAVTLTAGQVKSTLERVVNNTGVIRATGLSMQGGEIVLEGGTVLNAGTLDASSAVGKGGTVQMLGTQVGVIGTGSIDASGATGGGTVLVGGDYQGKNPAIQNANVTYVGSDATITADATQSGDGGKVIVWADDTTRAYGRISARGGVNGGDGGLIETSGKRVLDVTRAADASAPKGQAGTWLLDPNDITIQAAGPDTNTNVTGTNPLFYTSTNDSSIVTTGTIQNALNLGTSVNISTSSGGSQFGDITVADSISKTLGAAADLRLNAARNIIVNPGVTIQSTSSALNLGFNADSDANGTGYIKIAGTSGSSINLITNGGNVWLGGRDTTLTGAITGVATGDSTNGAGVRINYATINSGAGNINIYGQGASTDSDTFGHVGVYNGGSLITNGGNVNITGYGGSGLLTPNVSGISMAGDATAALTSIDTSAGGGSITLTGTGGSGGAAGAARLGVSLGGSGPSAAYLIKTGTGTLTVTGTGGADAGGSTGGRSTGVGIGSDMTLQSTSGGAINITGTGTFATGGSGHGVVLGYSSTNTAGHIESSGGAISITGTGASGAMAAGSQNGVVLEDGSTINGPSAGNSPITITGTAGASTSKGIYVEATRALNYIGGSTQAGNITLSAVNGDVALSNVEVGTIGGNITVQASNGSVLVSGGNGSTVNGGNLTVNGATGDITLRATGTGVEQGNVKLGGNVSVTGGGTHNLTLRADNDVWVINQAGSQTISASGTSLNIDLNSNRDASGTGAVGLGASGPSNTLMITTNGGSLMAHGGTATTTLAIGSNGTSEIATGVVVDPRVTINTGAGDIGLYGQGATANVTNPWGRSGVYNGGTLITNNGNVTIVGVGGSSVSGIGGQTGFVVGIGMAGADDANLTSIDTSAGSGSITLTGTGGTSGVLGAWRMGIALGGIGSSRPYLIKTGSGTLTVTGTGGADTGGGTGAESHGVTIGSGMMLQSTSGGAINITGTGTYATSGFAAGVVLGYDAGRAGHVESSSGAITITGNLADTTGMSASNVAGVMIEAGSTVNGLGTSNSAITISGSAGRSDARGGIAFESTLAQNSIGGASETGNITLTSVNSNLAINTVDIKTNGGNIDLQATNGNVNVTSGGNLAVNGATGNITLIATDASHANNNVGNVRLGGNVSVTGSGTHNLTLRGDNDVEIFNSAGLQTITSTTAALNIELNSNHDATGSGAVWLGATGGSSFVTSNPDDRLKISTNGGNLTAHGGATGSTDLTIGTATGTSTGVVVDAGVTVTTGIGNIGLYGRGASTTGSYDNMGVYNGGSLITQGTGPVGSNGNVTIVGQGGTGVSGSGAQYAAGIVMAGEDTANLISINTSGGSGSISLTGTGGASSKTGALRTGVTLGGPASSRPYFIKTGSGTLTVTGTGGTDTGATGALSHGVTIGSGMTLQSTNGGAINITGQGSFATNGYADGVVIGYANTLTAGHVESSGGAITITGTGASGAMAAGSQGGVVLEDGSTINGPSAGNSPITITGTAGASTSKGIYVEATRALNYIGGSTQAGDITLSAVNGDVALNNIEVRTNGGNLTLQASNGNVSVAGGNGSTVHGANLTVTGATGDITLSATGTGAYKGNVDLGGNVSVTGGGTHNLTLRGDNDVRVINRVGSQTIGSVAGTVLNVDLNSNRDAATDTQGGGVWLGASGTTNTLNVTTNGGFLKAHGGTTDTTLAIGSNGVLGDPNSGVPMGVVIDQNVVVDTGAGNIGLYGQGASANPSNPYARVGVVSNGTLRTTGGNVTIVGVGGSSGVSGVSGTGGQTGFVNGIVLAGSDGSNLTSIDTSAGSGSITLTGTGGTSAAADAHRLGVALGGLGSSQAYVIKTGSGTLTVTGTGGADTGGGTGAYSTGVGIGSGMSLQSSGGGAINITGTGTYATSGFAAGVALGYSNGTAGHIGSNGGAITIKGNLTDTTGMAATSVTGIGFRSGSTINSIGTANSAISISGDAGRADATGIYFDSTAAQNQLGGTSQTGTIVLKGDDIHFGSNTSIQTTGDVYFTPFTNGYAWNGDGSDINVINAVNTSVNRLYIGTGTINGVTTTAGALTLASTSAFDLGARNVTFTGQSVSVGNYQLSGSKNISLISTTGNVGFVGNGSVSAASVDIIAQGGITSGTAFDDIISTAPSGHGVSLYANNGAIGDSTNPLVLNKGPSNISIQTNASGANGAIYLASNSTINLDSGVPITTHAGTAETVSLSAQGASTDINIVGSINLGIDNLSLTSGRDINFNTGGVAITAGSLNLAGVGAAKFTQASGTIDLNAPVNATMATQFSGGGTTNFNSASANTLSGGTTWSAGTLGGTGTVTVSGALDVTGSSTIATNLATSGTSTINLTQPNGYVYLNPGKTWTNNGTLNIAGDDYLYAGGTLTNATSGTVNLNSSYATPIFGGTVNNAGTVNLLASGSHDINATLTQSGTINIASGSTFSHTAGFTNTGTLSGSGTIAVGTGTAKLVNQGNINPGGTGAAGTLSITGDLQLDTGSNLNIELGGTGAGQSDKLAVSGNITNTAGTLNASLLGGYTPVNTDAIAFLTMGGTASGTFTTTSLPVNFNVGYNLATGEAARLIYSNSNAITFTNASGGLDWATAGNWSTGNLPGSTDSALISSGLAVTHTTGTDAIAALSINSGNSLNVSGGSLAVSGATNLGGTLTVSGTGAATLNGALNGGGTGQTNVSGGTLTLNGASALNTLAVSGGMFNGSGSLSVNNSFNSTGGSIGNGFSSIALNQATGDLVAPALTAANAITLSTGGGNVVLNGAQTTTAAGSHIVVASAAGFTNTAGAGALSVGSGGRWLVYAANPSSVTKNGLTSNFRHYNATYANYAPGSVTESGNGFIYASSAGTLSVDTTLASAPGSANSIYGDTPMAVWTYALTGFADSEDNAGNIGLGGTAAFNNVATSTTHAGSYTVAYGGGLTSTSGYGLIAGSGAAYTVLQRALTVTANAQSKTYGAADPTLSYQVGATAAGTGLVNGDGLGGSLTRTAGETVAGGPYAIGQGSLAASSNYALTYTGANLTINPATLTVTANNASRTYGAANPVLSGSVSGFVNGELLANVTTGTETFSTSASNTSNVGNYGVTGSGLSANNGNYVFVQAAGNASALSVTPATLTVTANNASRTYGAANPVLSGSVFGFVNGELLANVTTGTETFSTSASNTSNVGNYGVTGSGLSANNGNYVFVQAAGNASALSVTPATLTVSANNASRTYGAANPSFTYGLSGFVNGENASSAGVTGTAALNTTATPASNVGTASITAGAGTLAAGNYTFGTLIDGLLTINPALLTVSTSNVSKTYDGGLSAAGAAVVTSGALFNGDTLNGGTFAFTDRNVGSNKTVTASGITVTTGNSGNYTVSYAPNTTSTITQLASVAWTGGATGNWSNAANWAGGALPDGANVAAVTIPGGVNVTYDSGVAGTTTLNSLTSSGGLALAAGTLALNGSSSINALNLSGGTLTGAGNVSVTNSFSQTAGSINKTGSLSITQASGDLTLGQITAGSLSLTANGGAILEGLSGTAPTLGAASTTLHAATGIGSSSAPLRMATTALLASTTAGPVQIANTPSGLVHLTGLTTGDASPVTYKQNGQALLLDGSISSQGGDILIDPPTDFTMTPASAVDSHGGAVTLQASGNMSLASVNAGSGTVLIQSSGGQIGTATPGVNNVTAGDLTLDAATGIQLAYIAPVVHVSSTSGLISVTDSLTGVTTTNAPPPTTTITTDVTQAISTVTQQSTVTTQSTTTTAPLTSSSTFDDIISNAPTSAGTNTTTGDSTGTTSTTTSSTTSSDPVVQAVLQTIFVASFAIQKPVEQLVQLEAPKGAQLVCR